MNLTKFQKEVLARFDKVKLMLKVAEQQRICLKKYAQAHEGLLTLILNSDPPAPDSICNEEEVIDISDDEVKGRLCKEGCVNPKCCCIGPYDGQSNHD